MCGWDGYSILELGSPDSHRKADNKKKGAAPQVQATRQVFDNKKVFAQLYIKMKPNMEKKSFLLF